MFCLPPSHRIRSVTTPKFLQNMPPHGGTIMLFTALSTQLSDSRITNFRRKQRYCLLSLPRESKGVMAHCILNPALPNIPSVLL